MSTEVDRWSDGSLVRRVVGPKKGRWSENVYGSLVRIKGRWSERLSGKTWSTKLSSNGNNDRKRARVVGPKDCLAY